MSAPDVSGVSILNEYDERCGAYAAFATCLQVLLAQIIRPSAINPQSITCRLKSRKSLEEKLSRPGKTYSQLADITDVAGVRVITYFAAEVDQVAAILEREFQIDRASCVDKRIYEDPDRFGYKSLHYVVSLKPDRANLLEYDGFKTLKAEIQLRTVIQHAWAEIEHDLGYKSIAAVPRDAKRRLFRLAALLEMADEEFTAVKDTLVKRSSEVRADLRRGDFDLDLDSTSLAEFIASDSAISDSDVEITRRTNIPLQQGKWLGIHELATWLRSVGVITIQQLRELFTQKRGAIIDFAVKRLTQADVRAHTKTLSQGVAILYASYYVAAGSGGQARILEFLNANGFRSTKASNEDIAKTLMELYTASSASADVGNSFLALPK